MGLDKVYEGEITLGSVTESYDLEHEPQDFRDIDHLEIPEIKEAIKKYEGDIMQMPPMHSAIKKDGQRLYKLARKGVKVEIKPRPVRIDSFEMLDYTDGKLQFRVACSTGTYIRSLAHDLGKDLGVGGHLSRLVRTQIGDHKLEDAYELDDLVQFYEQLDKNT